jgi:hypothetical protein
MSLISPPSQFFNAADPAVLKIYIGAAQKILAEWSDVAEASRALLEQYVDTALARRS